MAKQDLSAEVLGLLKPSTQFAAHHYVSVAHGLHDAKLVEANTKKLLALGAGSSLSCEITFGPFQLSVKLKNGQTFIGSGSFGPSFATSGVILTDDLNKLYQAQQYSYVSTFVNFYLIFYDDAGNVLGTLQSGPVFLGGAVGGGRGKWSTPSPMVLKASPQLIANDYVNFAYGHHDAKLIESNVKKLISLHATAKPVASAAEAAEAAPAAAAPAAATSYPGHGSIASLIFGFKIQVELNKGKQINGWAGGIGTPGGGFGFGDVYTDNINKLYSDTVAFSFVSAVAYFTVIFYDTHGNTLGSFQSGGLSTVAATGRGSAKWS
jgi:hypothetical protein